MHEEGALARCTSDLQVTVALILRPICQAHMVSAKKASKALRDRIEVQVQVYSAEHLETYSRYSTSLHKAHCRSTFQPNTYPIDRQEGFLAIEPVR